MLFGRKHSFGLHTLQRNNWDHSNPYREGMISIYSQIAFTIIISENNEFSFDPKSLTHRGKTMLEFKKPWLRLIERNWWNYICTILVNKAGVSGSLETDNSNRDSFDALEQFTINTSFCDIL